MKNYGYLTNEEYKAFRKCLGFTQDEATNFHGMNNKQTLVYWENGKSTVSRPACDKITELMDKINDKIEEVIQNWEETQQDVFLITYDDEDYTKYVYGLGRDLPNSVHTMLQYRTYIELKRLNANAYIVKFNKSSYAYYLAENGAMDSLDNRFKWAKWYRLNYFNVLPEEKEEKRIITHTLEEMYLWLTDHTNLRAYNNYMEIVKLRMDGNNLTQVAQILGKSRQRVNKLFHDLDDLIGD